MGTLDRVVRAVVAAPVLIVVGFVLGVGSLFGIAAFVVAGVMLATATVGYCPAYTPFGVSTRGGISTKGRVRLGGRSRAVAQRG